MTSRDTNPCALLWRYEAEQIEVADLGELTDLSSSPAPLVQLIDKQSVMRSSQADLSQTDRRGLLWLLDEESIFPGTYSTVQRSNSPKV